MQLRNSIVRLGLLIQIFLIIIAPWSWRILKRDLLVATLIFSSSILIYLIFSAHKANKYIFLFLLLSIIIFVLMFKNGFDQSIFVKSALDIQRYNNRHEYLARELDKAYKNRFSIFFYDRIYQPIYKIQRNIFSNLDLNLYFFASHPRERVGVEEFEKYPFILLPIFIGGLLYLLKKQTRTIFLYLVLITLLSSMISPKYELGPLLFFPFINLSLTLGSIWLFSKTKILK